MQRINHLLTALQVGLAGIFLLGLTRPDPTFLFTWEKPLVVLHIRPKFSSLSSGRGGRREIGGASMIPHQTKNTLKETTGHQLITNKMLYFQSPGVRTCLRARRRRSDGDGRRRRFCFMSKRS